MVSDTGTCLRPRIAGPGSNPRSCLCYNNVMETSNLLTQSHLQELLHYNPETGIFTWLVSRSRTRAGEIADYVNNRGYVRIRICSVEYLAHRLAWLYMTGGWPKDQIDHINGIRNDNRWANLREADRFINQQNQRKPRPNNVTGFLGVSPEGNRFVAQIGLRGKKYSLGAYHTPEQAHKAYIEAKRRLHEGCTI